MPHTHFFFFLAFWGIFDAFDGVISRYFRQRPQNYSHWKLPPFFDIWWKFEVKDQGRVVPVLRGVKKPSFWNWFEVVILVIIVYYTFSILFFFPPFLFVVIVVVVLFHSLYVYIYTCMHIYIIYIYTYITYIKYIEGKQWCTTIYQGFEYIRLLNMSEYA